MTLRLTCIFFISSVLSKFFIMVPDKHRHLHQNQTIINTYDNHQINDKNFATKVLLLTLFSLDMFCRKNIQILFFFLHNSTYVR